MATDDEMLMMEICAMIEENRDAAYRAYWVECAKEMGWQDNGYKYYSDLLEGTSFNPDDALPQILNDPVYCPETTKLEVMNYVQTYIY